MSVRLRRILAGLRAATFADCLILALMLDAETRAIVGMWSESAAVSSILSAFFAALFAALSTGYVTLLGQRKEES